MAYRHHTKYILASGENLLAWESGMVKPWNISSVAEPCMSLLTWKAFTNKLINNLTVQHKTHSVLWYLQDRMAEGRSNISIQFLHFLSKNHSGLELHFVHILIKIELIMLFITYTTLKLLTLGLPIRMFTILDNSHGCQYY
jgi:hypothetical protein